MSTIEEDLRFLITELQEERTNTGDELATCPIPGTFGEAWNLFRALCNTRLPEHVSGEFLAKQDKLLHAIIDEEGITYAGLIPPCASDPRFAVWRGDITTLAADAIVNAANSQLLGCWVPGHYCIDNAIHTFAGVQLRIECAAIMRAQGHEEPTGQAKVTSAYNLPSSLVIHTVGPIVENGKPTEQHKRLLAASYRNCLDAAAERRCKSIAFCCISTGVFGFPQEEAAHIAVDTVRAWLDANPKADMHVIFDVYTEKDEQTYRDILGE